MPQEIRVVQCFQCEMFQVDIVKKSNKWQCKVCNTKQSLRKELFRGSGAECRKKVQDLNYQKGECHLQEANTILDHLKEGDEFVMNGITHVSDTNISIENCTKRANTENKWNAFLAEPTKRKEVHDSVPRLSNQTLTDFQNKPHETNKRSKWTEFF